MNQVKRIFNSLAIIALLFSLITPSITADSVKNPKLPEKVSEKVLEQFVDNEQVTFLVKFKEKANTIQVVEEAKDIAIKLELSEKNKERVKRSAVISELKTTSTSSQQRILDFLEGEKENGNVSDIRSYYIVNGIAVTATKEVAEALATFSEVEKILPNEKRQLNKVNITNTPSESGETIKTPSSSIEDANVEWNVKQVGAPEVWDMGIDGTGTVVAIIDSGADWDHPALKEKYRGYNTETGEVDHTYSWFDATEKGLAEPYDDIGHGTHVTGTIVGSEPDGTNKIGVAPGAEWIMVKAFSAEGATDVDLLEAAQWILAPGGNPDFAPDVVNNSWSGGPGLNEWYLEVVNNWRAVGIFPEFSAGNVGPSNSGGPASIANPANYQESFATGAIDKNNVIANFSLRGPSPYGEVKPDISAPGVNIRSSIPGAGYQGGWEGTSMAGPAVSGVVALLRQADPLISVANIEQILIQTATPLTDSTYPMSPNNGYGYGLVNALEAVKSVVSLQSVDRIFGYSRFDTAIEISKSGWEQANKVVIAKGHDFADALAGVPLAHNLNAPILLTPSNKLWEPVLEEIQRLGAQEVIVLGGELAVSEDVVRELQANGLKVRRIAGGSRYETAGKIASEVSGGRAVEVVVANGLDFPDALSVAAYAAKEGTPILLTRSEFLPKGTIDALAKLGTNKSIVVGGELVVSDEVVNELPNATRISGRNRYDTNIEIAKYYSLDVDHAYIATGKQYADALTGAVLAARNNSGILLVHAKAPPATVGFLEESDVNQLTILGGEVAVSSSVVEELKKLLK